MLSTDEQTVCISFSHLLWLLYEGWVPHKPHAHWTAFGFAELLLHASNMPCSSFWGIQITSHSKTTLQRFAKCLQNADRVTFTYCTLGNSSYMKAIWLKKNAPHSRHSVLNPKVIFLGNPEFTNPSKGPKKGVHSIQ